MLSRRGAVLAWRPQTTSRLTQGAPRAMLARGPGPSAWGLQLELSRGFHMERLAFLAALTASVLAYTYYPRMPHRQLRRIGDAFNKPNPALKQNVLLRRLPEEQVFKSFFGSQPAGHPLVAVGPDGSSKSVAMRSALRGRTNVLYIDLRQTGVQNESEFIYEICEAIGFLDMYSASRDILQQWLLRQRRGDGRSVNKHEVEKAFDLLRNYLIEEKRAKWPRGVPVLAFNGLEVLTKSVAKGDKTELTSFLNLCLWASDAQLAHVAFSTTRYFSIQHLDTLRTWRTRREVLEVRYASRVEVEDFLTSRGAEMLRERGLPPLDAAQVAEVADSVGGCMTDLTDIMTAAMRGGSTRAAVNRLVSGSGDFLVELMERRLQEAAERRLKGLVDEDKFWLKKYLRVWHLMELLAAAGEEGLRRAEVVSTVFRMQPHELDDLVDLNMVVRYQASGSGTYAVPTGSGAADSPQQELYVVPYAPRMRQAFRKYMECPEHLEARGTVKNQLLMYKCKAKKRVMVEQLVYARGERRDLLLHQQSVLHAQPAVLEAAGPSITTALTLQLDSVTMRLVEMDRSIREHEVAIKEVEDQMRSVKESFILPGGHFVDL